MSNSNNRTCAGYQENMKLKQAVLMLSLAIDLIQNEDLNNCFLSCFNGKKGEAYQG